MTFISSYIFMITISYLLILLNLLISIAYLTLLERKVLSEMQMRVGPQKIGMLQPWADGLKLFKKCMMTPHKGYKVMYQSAAVINLGLCFALWVLIETIHTTYNFNYGLLYFSMISGLGVYGIMMAGWSAGSYYSSLGTYRAVAQMISYEVSLFMILLFILMKTNSFNINETPIWLSSLMPIVLFMWFTSMLGELNRSPFDLVEGESELVSGFNTEYSGALFSLLFLAEYGNILFMCILTSILFSNWGLFWILMMMVLWMRAALPRSRYDKLMMMMWTLYLPFLLAIFIL